MWFPVSGVDCCNVACALWRLQFLTVDHQFVLDEEVDKIAFFGWCAAPAARLCSTKAWVCSVVPVCVQSTMMYRCCSATSVDR